uniref:eukaryotic translation initiation factor 5A-like n=1 Tax=Fragaria vesca subsp. vesca TaxID=101020 RepID=UPI0005C90D75|nr:PREDICTED: eukaryotic translation initiation factor 5A-like [Fragaria vesca subsp. vesca]
MGVIGDRHRFSTLLPTLNTNNYSGQDQSNKYDKPFCTIQDNDYILIHNRSCKVAVFDICTTVKEGGYGYPFFGIDIFTDNALDDVVIFFHNCEVPHVLQTKYDLIDVSNDEFMLLLNDIGNIQDNLNLLKEPNLLTQIIKGFAKGNNPVATVISSMGEDRVSAFKDM